MVVDSIGAVGAVVGFLWHRPFLAKERGFLHPLKQVVSAEKNDMSSRVTIPPAFRREE
jgi:hypothetical protein